MPDQAHWFAAEVQPHEPALRAYLRRKYPGLSDVDDVVQESFVKTLAARQGGKLTSIKGFLFRVAGNAAVSVFRRRKFISDTPVSAGGPQCVIVGDANVVEEVCTRDELQLVGEAIVALPERCREIVRLRVIEGRDYAAIGEQLGLSEATVRVQMSRGMKKCAEFLRERQRVTR
jgi:RNA polymerase sigma-70 factor (ECF subfamily)